MKYMQNVSFRPYTNKFVVASIMKKQDTISHLDPFREVDTFTLNFNIKLVSKHVGEYKKKYNCSTVV